MKQNIRIRKIILSIGIGLGYMLLSSSGHAEAYCLKAQENTSASYCDTLKEKFSSLSTSGKLEENIESLNALIFPARIYYENVNIIKLPQQSQENETAFKLTGTASHNTIDGERTSYEIDTVLIFKKDVKDNTCTMTKDSSESVVYEVKLSEDGESLEGFSFYHTQAQSICTKYTKR